MAKELLAMVEYISNIFFHCQPLLVMANVIANSFKILFFLKRKLIND